jgi:hypothetical protein
MAELFCLFSPINLPNLLWLRSFNQRHKTVLIEYGIYENVAF